MPTCIFTLSEGFDLALQCLSCKQPSGKIACVFTCVWPIWDDYIIAIELHLQRFLSLYHLIWLWPVCSAAIIVYFDSLHYSLSAMLCCVCYCCIALLIKTNAHTQLVVHYAVFSGSHRCRVVPFLFSMPIKVICGTSHTFVKACVCILQ